MRLFTTAVTGQFIIHKSDNVIQFSVIAASDDADFTIQGNAEIQSTPSTPVTFPVGSGGYNSAQASPTTPWERTIITVNAGTVNLAMTQE